MRHSDHGWALGIAEFESMHVGALDSHLIDREALFLCLVWPWGNRLLGLHECKFVNEFIWSSNKVRCANQETICLKPKL